MGAVMPIPPSVKSAVIMCAERWPTDRLDIWAFALGAIALSLSALGYIADRDPIAVSIVLIAFAAILGVVLLESAQNQEQA